MDIKRVVDCITFLEHLSMMATFGQVPDVGVVAQVWALKDTGNAVGSPVQKKTMTAGVPTSNDWKQSFTDVEETAQWLSGTDFVSSIFESLLNLKNPDRSPHGFVVHNAPCYDACLERCLCVQPTSQNLVDKPICTASWTFSTEILAFMQKNIINCLVEQWKAGKGPLHITPHDTHKPWNEAIAALENSAETPTFSICRLIDLKLVLPQEVRERFLRDPVRSNEWREVLGKFDAAYSGSPGAQPAATAVVAAAEAPGPEPAARGFVAPVNVGSPESMYSWFPGEPKTFELVKAQYPNNLSFDHGNGKCFFVLVETPVEGEQDVTVKKLFLVGKETVTLGGLDDAAGYFLGHASGTWYQAAKAVKFVKDNPGKGFVADWNTDEVLCVLEQNGRDDKPVKLREVLHDIERQGAVGFELSGHKLDRPPEVINGSMADMSAAQSRRTQSELSPLSAVALAQSL